MSSTGAKGRHGSTIFRGGLGTQVLLGNAKARDPDVIPIVEKAEFREGYTKSHAI